MRFKKKKKTVKTHDKRFNIVSTNHSIKYNLHQGCTLQKNLPRTTKLVNAN